MAGILIADAGGTSTTWCMCDNMTGIMTDEIITGGINAAVYGIDEIDHEIEIAARLINKSTHIYFYGAGCRGCNTVTVRNLIGKRAPSASKIEVQSDMLGAARALFSHSSGIACILGTGSNSCLYNGEEIIDNVPPLGYILGDEGSGASLGKALLKSVLRNDLTDKDIINDIEVHSGASVSELLNRVYKNTSANRFLASLAPVIHRHIYKEKVRSIVDNEFNLFFNNCVSHYCKSGVKKIGFIGSLAYAFRDDLNAISKKFGFAHCIIEASPLKNLMAYHTTYQK